MKKIKLNRRGFTLIELLAVIVILAIIIVITVPTILDSMDTSRKSSLHSSAKGIANWYDEAVVADQLVGTNERKLTGILEMVVDDKWVCIGSLVNTASSTDNPNYGGKSFADMTELLASDVNLSTTNVYNGTESSITSNTCSSIRNGRNGVEVLLVAVRGGRFDVSSESVTYALSSAEGGVAR